MLCPAGGTEHVPTEHGRARLSVHGFAAYLTLKSPGNCQCHEQGARCIARTEGAVSRRVQAAVFGLSPCWQALSEGAGNPTVWYKLFSPLSTYTPAREAITTLWNTCPGMQILHSLVSTGCQLHGRVRSLTHDSFGIPSEVYENASCHRF